MKIVYVMLQLQVALPVILAANLVLFLMAKSYWCFLLPIAVWALLIISFFWLAASNTRAADRIEQAYDESARGKGYGDTALWQRLNDRKEQARRTQGNLFFIIGAQTLLALAFQIAGYVKAKKRNLFWWTRTLFIVLAIAWLLLAALWSAVPTGPMI
jgi:hypothetical protein